MSGDAQLDCTSFTYSLCNRRRIDYRIFLNSKYRRITYSACGTYTIACYHSTIKVTVVTQWRALNGKRCRFDILVNNVNGEVNEACTVVAVYLPLILYRGRNTSVNRHGGVCAFTDRLVRWMRDDFRSFFNHHIYRCRRNARRITCTTDDNMVCTSVCCSCI